METKYINVTETAKLIRKQLKAKFPGVKFSVRSDKYAGGASIDISWTDGPAQSLVDQAVAGFRGAGFDGMNDMKYSKDSWLMPDGSVFAAASAGTEGSAGMTPGYSYDAPGPDAKLVSFGADFIFCRRDYSIGFMERALICFRAKWGDMADRIEIVDGFRGARVSAQDYDAERLFYQFVNRRMVAGH